jgi:hypothetical protein
MKRTRPIKYFLAKDLGDQMTLKHERPLGGQDMIS